MDPRRTGNPDVGRLFQQVENTQAFLVPEQVVFDRQQFEASTMYDLALQREILGMFFGQLDQVIARLEQGPLSIEESKFMGHTLRGAAAALGAREVQKLASDWEKRLCEPVSLLAGLTAAKANFSQSVIRYLPQAELQ
jgi:HPt (histidine-containing phosphotransfer) domain-containing protein